MKYQSVVCCVIMTVKKSGFRALAHLLDVTFGKAHAANNLCLFPSYK